MNRLRRLSVRSPRNSICGSARLEDLDWDRGWWTDYSFSKNYLHVWHKDGETIHRVRCRRCDRPRLEMRQGALLWLIDPGEDAP